MLVRQERLVMVAFVVRDMTAYHFTTLCVVAQIDVVCDNILSGYLSEVTTVFSQQDGIYGIKFLTRFFGDLLQRSHSFVSFVSFDSFLDLSI